MTTKPTMLQSPVVRELRWIVLAMIITLVIIRLLIALKGSKGSLYINLYDTYFVIDGKWLLWVAAIPSLFLVSLVRIIGQRNRSGVAYWLALASGLITVIGLNWLSNFMIHLFPKTGINLFVITIEQVVLIALLGVAYQIGVDERRK